MSELVFLTGDYCSGSTLMFTLIRNTGEFCTLYEPLHGRLPQYLIRPLRPYERHFNVGSYFDEFEGMRRIPALFDPAWAVSDLLLESGDAAPALRRYLDYLIEEGTKRAPRVAIKDNRLAFRLGWLRQNYPQAKIVHIHRERGAQWASLVRRVQSHLGRIDVGQDDPGFNGFTVGAWCDDLAPHFPELAVERSATGYERFAKLWARSIEHGRRHADLVVSFEELTADFDHVWPQVAACVGSERDAVDLAHLVVTAGEPPSPLLTARRSRRLGRVAERAGERYAEIRVAVEAARWRRGQAEVGRGRRR